MARQNFVGLVVSQGKMQKTAKVRVQTKTYDSVVHKEIIRRKDYLVHDEGDLCREGDIVRIEAIPKISARKYFAVAEIKVNKGQQFALYEQLANEKVKREEQLQIERFFARRREFERTITHVADLRALDRLALQFQNDPAADREALLAQIDAIKRKYNIRLWPATQPVLPLEVRQELRDLLVMANRIENIKLILDKLYTDEYAAERGRIVAELGAEDKPRATQRNLVRKWIVDPKNECPVVL